MRDDRNSRAMTGAQLQVGRFYNARPQPGGIGTAVSR
jgi:hypothetical protein